MSTMALDLNKMILEVRKSQCKCRAGDTEVKPKE